MSTVVVVVVLAMNIHKSWCSRTNQSVQLVFGRCQWQLYIDRDLCVDVIAIQRRYSFADDVGKGSTWPDCHRSDDGRWRGHPLKSHHLHRVFFRDVTSAGKTSGVYSLEGVLADKLPKVESYDICTGVL